MAKIGTLEVKFNEMRDEYQARGSIRTIDTSLAFSLSAKPKGDQQSERAPTHVIEVKTKDGEFIEVGAAWQREMKRGDNVGQPMFSLSFSDPSLPEWMGNLAAFPSGEKSDAGNPLYRIEFERKRRDAAQNEAEHD